MRIKLVHRGDFHTQMPSWRDDSIVLNLHIQFNVSRLTFRDNHSNNIHATTPYPLLHKKLYIKGRKKIWCNISLHTNINAYNMATCEPAHTCIHIFLIMDSMPGSREKCGANPIRISQHGTSGWLVLALPSSQQKPSAIDQWLHYLMWLL